MEMGWAYWDRLGRTWEGKNAWVYLIRVCLIRMSTAVLGRGGEVRIKNVSVEASAPLQSIDT